MLAFIVESFPQFFCTFEVDTSINSIAWAPTACGCPCLASASSSGRVSIHLNANKYWQQIHFPGKEGWLASSGAHLYIKRLIYQNFKPFTRSELDTTNWKWQCTRLCVFCGWMQPERWSPRCLFENISVLFRDIKILSKSSYAQLTSLPILGFHTRMWKFQLYLS